MSEDAATDKAGPSLRLNGWQRIGMVLSILWFTFIAGVIVVNQNRANVFDAMGNTSCDFKIPPFFVWYDGKSGQELEEVAISRIPKKTDPMWEGFTSCDDIHKVISAGMLDGSIEPVPHLVASLAAAMTFLPVVVAWVLIYLVVYTIKWVVRGFRKPA